MAQASPETALATVEQEVETGVVEWNLDAFPEDRYNRLLPTQTLMVPTDLLRPVVQVVQLNPDPTAGDVYHSEDMPAGHAAPTKVGLRKFATAAGISIVDERRTDDGRDPDVIEVTCWAEMLMPTGQRIRATGQKRVDLNAQKWRSDNHRLKYRSFFLEHVSSRAQNRAIRSLLSLRGSYPTQVYQRPFAVVSFAPNMAHPEVRSRILDAMAPAVGQLYGPAGEQKALAPGAPIDVTPAPDEDPAPATPTVLPGEKLAAAEGSAVEGEFREEPDWIGGPAAAAETKADPPTFVERIRHSAADPAAPKGKATKPLLEQLGGILRPLAGERLVTPGWFAIWPDGNPAEPTAAQARAIILAAESDEAFELHWRELVASAAER